MNILSNLTSFTGDRLAAMSEAVALIQDIAFLLQDWEFSDRELKIAGLDVEALRKIRTGLFLLTDA